MIGVIGLMGGGGTPRLFKSNWFVCPAHLVMPIREHLIKKITKGGRSTKYSVIPTEFQSMIMRVDVEDIKKP
jgi:hypothetical protein